jgi:phage I-like protein
VIVSVEVESGAAEALEEQRKTLTQIGKKPFFSIEHNSDKAAFWPSKFVWDTRKDATGVMATGVWAEGTWTGGGKEARDGKDYRTFSPTFHLDAYRNDEDNPGRVVCQPEAKANMGALVNDPAFRNMSPLWARDASDPKKAALKATVRTRHDALAASGAYFTLETLCSELKASDNITITEDEAAVCLT